MAQYDVCPICRRNFADCSHSLTEAEKYVDERKLDQKIRRIVQEELKTELRKYEERQRSR